MVKNARERDIGNGYWAGFYAGLEKIQSFPKEEIERNGQERDN